MLVNQCQLWIARLTASLAAVTTRELLKLTNELQVKKQELSSQTDSWLNGEPTSSDPAVDAEEGWFKELRGRVEGLKENITALAFYRVCQSNVSILLPSWPFSIFPST